MLTINCENSLKKMGITEGMQLMLALSRRQHLQAKTEWEWTSASTNCAK